MKARRLEEVIKERGFEKGTLFTLMFLIERYNAQQKAIAELASMQEKIIESLQNVVQGATGMRAHMIETLKKAGFEEAKDDLPESTQDLN